MTFTEVIAGHIQCILMSMAFLYKAHLNFFLTVTYYQTCVYHRAKSHGNNLPTLFTELWFSIQVLFLNKTFIFMIFDIKNKTKHLHDETEWHSVLFKQYLNAVG